MMQQNGPAAPAIKLDNVSLSFGNDSGVYDLNLSVAPGTILGLIGPSGSGKTTTVRLMTGIYRPSSGSISVLGQTPYDFSGSLRERIGYIPQQFVLYPNLTVWENLSFAASLYGMPYGGRRRRMREMLSFVELDNTRNRLARQLSGGMQRRLSLACALVHRPELIFADEPTAGIDPVLRGKLWEAFRALRDEQRTLVITTQYVGEISYCDMVGVIQDGHLAYFDTPDGLRRTAMGGEVVRVTVDVADEQRARVRLDQLPFVYETRRSREVPGELFAQVERAAEALPQVITALSEEPAIPVRAAEEHKPPLDDIFITLMQRRSALGVSRPTENSA